jgi:hypothetical protein
MGEDRDALGAEAAEEVEGLCADTEQVSHPQSFVDESDLGSRIRRATCSVSQSMSSRPFHTSVCRRPIQAA